MSTGLHMFGNQIRQPRSPFAPAQPIQSPFQIPAFQNPAPGIPRPQEPQLPEYEFTEQPKEEQQSIIRSIADTGISGLQKGANLLSTPGDVIRNLIAGKPLGESFAPLLSPTSSENRTTGRDILRQQGLIGDEDTWGNFLAGVATEIVTDPLTLLTGGLSKGGQLAARAKALDTAKFAAAKKLNKEVGRVGPRQARSITTLRELIDEAPKEQADTLRAMLSRYSQKRQEKILNQTLGGPLAFALPGMMPIVPGLGKAGEAYTEGVDSLMRGIQFGKPLKALGIDIAPVNDFLNLFSKRSNETRSPTARAYARQAFEDQQAGRYGAKMEAYDVMDELKGTEFVTEEGQEKLRELLTAKTEIGLTPLDFQNAAAPLMRAGFVKDKATDIQKLFSDPNFLATQDQEVVDAVDNLITNFGVNNADEVKRLQGLMELKSPLERQPQKIQESLGVLKGAGQRMLNTAQHYGIPMKYLNDMYADYFARQKSGGKVKGATQTTAFAANDFGQKARLDFFRDIPGAEKTLNEVLSDEDIWQLIDSSADSDTIAEALRAKFGNIVPDRYTTLEERRRIEAINKEIDIKNAKISKQNQERVAKGQEPKPLIPRKTPKTKDRFKALGKFMENQASEDLANGIFTNSPFADFIVRRSVASDYEKQLENAVRLLAEPGVIQNRYVRGQNQPLLKMISKLRLKPGQLVTDEAGDLLPLEDMDGFLPRIAEELERRGIAQASDIDPKGMFVRNDIAEDILRFIKPFTAPESTTRWYELYDSAMNFHKAMLTGVRPAFHVRNLMSATLKNALRNMIDVQSLKDTWDLMRGKTVRNASKIPKVREYWTEMGNSLDQLDDQKATEVLGRMLAASGQGPRLGGELANKIGATVDPDPGSISEILGGVTGRGNKVLSFREFARKVAGMSDDSSWKVRDWINVDKLAPITSGKYLGGAIEAFARTSPMIYLMRQGYDPVVAARRVAEAQVDYGSRNYTKLELQRMTRLFPFYKFTRGTIPEELRYLAQNPGGLESQLIRQSGRTSENDELTPDYVAESVSIPTTGTPLDYGKPAGTDRYVTGFGFAFEDPFAFLSGGGRGAIGETISRMNPLVKGAIEWGSGESFFQRTPTGGRELADQDPNIGRLMANLTGLEKPVRFAYQEPIEFLAANSPISPFLTIARQLTDTRKNSLAKAANLLTGIKVTDVSPAVKDQLLRGFVEQQMVKRGAKQFLRTYYPKEELATLSPDEQMEILQLQSIANMLAEETKKRKALKEQEKQRANLIKSQSME